MGLYVVGVDVGGTNTKLGLVHPSGKVISRTSFATKPFAPSKAKLINAFASEIQALMVKAGVLRKHIAGIGIGLPGLVDYAAGVVKFLPNIPGWRNVPLKKMLQQKLRLPVFIDNDLKLITLAEWKFGAGRGAANMVCLTLGTGVGSGLILNDRLYRGQGYAGELGHVPINEQGPACGCGSSGCLETYVGNRRLVARANAILGQPGMTLERMFALAQSGNAKALQFWKEAATHLGNGLVSVVNLLNPSVIVVGGGVANNHKFLFKTVSDVINRRALVARAAKVKIVRAALGDDAGIIGAQVLVNNA